MNSASEQRKRPARTKGPAAKRIGDARQPKHGIGEADRIVVRSDGQTISIHYRGTDSETRYLPREQSPWQTIREIFRMG